MKQNVVEDHQQVQYLYNYHKYLIKPKVVLVQKFLQKKIISSKKKAIINYKYKPVRSEISPVGVLRNNSPFVST